MRSFSFSFLPSAKSLLVFFLSYSEGIGGTPRLGSANYCRQTWTCFSKHSFIGIQLHPFAFLFPSISFALQGLGCVVGTEIVCSRLSRVLFSLPSPPSNPYVELLSPNTSEYGLIWGNRVFAGVTS